MREPIDDADIVRQAIDRLSELDVDGALELVTEDVVLELPFRAGGEPRRLQGDDARQFMRQLPLLLTRIQFVDVVVHGALPGGTIVAEYRSQGQTVGGRPYDNTYAAFFELRGHRISVWREYFDPMVIRRAFASS